MNYPMVCKLNFIYIIYIIYISLKFTFCTPTQKLLTLLTIDYLFRKELSFPKKG